MGKKWGDLAWFKQGRRDNEAGRPVRHAENADYMKGYRYHYRGPAMATKEDR